MALGWMPKGTVQAALGATCLNFAETSIEDPELKAEWVKYGNVMLTCAVFAIILAAPIGAMIVNTLGFIWLDK